MNKLCLFALSLSCTAAHAQVYHCPDTYPAKKGGAHLMSAEIRVGQRNGNALHGDIVETKDGTSVRYNLPEAMPRWMVCQYGGKRIGGTSITPGRIVDAQEWWIQLDPLSDVCDMDVNKDGIGNGWTATAHCKGKELPTPVMLE